MKAGMIELVARAGANTRAVAMAMTGAMANRELTTELQRRNGKAQGDGDCGADGRAELRHDDSIADG